jgi:hypothetical protein
MREGERREVHAAVSIGFSLFALLWPAVLSHVAPLCAPVYSNDSIWYAQMAEGLLGFPERPIGFRTLDWDGQSATFNTTFPIGYPLMIATVSLTGVGVTASALMVPFLCFCLNGLLVFQIARRNTRNTNEFLALFVSILVSSAYPVLHVAWTAWSETPALTAALFSLWLLPSCLTERRAALRCGLAGIAAGMTMWIRYAMFPFPAVCVVALASTLRRRGAVPAAAAGIVCVLASVIALVSLNIGMGGALFGDYRPPAEESLLKNAATMANHVTYTVTGFVGERSDCVRFVISGGLFLVLVGASALVAPGQIAQGRMTLPHAVAMLFAISYPAFIVYARSRTQFDPIDVRFMSPFLATFAIAFVGPAFGEIFRSSGRSAGRMAAGALSLLFLGGIPLTWMSVAPQQASQKWRFEVTRQGTVYRDVAKAVPEPEAAVITNSHELVYLWDRGPAISIDRPLTAGLVDAFEERIDVSIYLFVRYDHPAFKASRVGPFVAELFFADASDRTRLVFDDGKARLWQICRRRRS